MDDGGDLTSPEQAAQIIAGELTADTSNDQYMDLYEDVTLELAHTLGIDPEQDEDRFVALLDRVDAELTKLGVEAPKPHDWQSTNANGGTN